MEVTVACAPLMGRSGIILLLAILMAPGLDGYGRQTAVRTEETDLDRLLERVLARRDDNWKKLQQYVLEERETLEVLGPDGGPLYGFRRAYTWFIKEGFFVRSPLHAGGVEVGESERRRYEDEWIARERRRELRAARREGRPAPALGSMQDVLRQSVEPQFVSAAYFLRFKFDPGRYALVGPEVVDGRSALKIEYYPTNLFTEGRTRPSRRLRERQPEIGEKLNKVSLVTLWIDPSIHQILRYTFDNVDTDFLPGGSIVRLDEARASMRMVEAFPAVWLPDRIEIDLSLQLAVGTIAARYAVQYHDYRLAEVTTKVR